MGRGRRLLVPALRRAGLLEPLLARRDQAAGLRRRATRAAAERRHRAALAAHPDLLLVQHDGRWDVARRDDRLVVADVARANLDLVAAALREGDVPYFAVPATTPGRYRLAVPAVHRARALDALVAAADPALRLYLDDTALPRRRHVTLGRPLPARVRARVLRRPVWRAYVSRADGHGRTVLGHPHGSEIELWTQPRTAAGERTGTLVAPRWNTMAVELPEDAAGSGALRIGDGSHPAPPAFAAGPHYRDVTFPVDVVYTWVDGADAAWLERKRAVLSELNLAGSHPDAYDISRYRSRDELRYSLRSVAMYADFVRRVFIVTDDQVPPWLATGNPRVRVVHHKDIFGGHGRLPTFNSHAIESRLHHIDGLAEHYLYLNDDFLFCRRVTPELFFLSNGLSRFFPSTALIASPDGGAVDRSVDVAARNSQELVRRHFGRFTAEKIKHAPYPQRRSVLDEAEELFAAEFERTAASQVRSPSDLPIPSAFFHYYAYLTGRAVPGEIAARYVDVARDDFDRRLRDLERVSDADTLCVNDALLESTPELARRERRLRDFLDTMWPVPSEFER